MFSGLTCVVLILSFMISQIYSAYVISHNLLPLSLFAYVYVMHVPWVSLKPFGILGPVLRPGSMLGS